MRNRLILLTAAVLLSACADDQHATSPSSRSGLASRSVAGDAAPSNGGIMVAYAKPTDQVGFTKITVVVSTPLLVSAGGQGVAAAACPAGTVAVGGGFKLNGYQAAASPPWILVSERTDVGGQTGWEVGIDDEQPGANGVNFSALAYCAS